VLVTGDGNRNGGWSNFFEQARGFAQSGWRVEIWAWGHNVSGHYKDLVKTHSPSKGGDGRVQLVLLDEYESKLRYRAKVRFVAPAAAAAAAAAAVGAASAAASVCRADVCAAPSPLSLPTDLNALSVRELKDILASRAIDYRDCCEKSHLVERVSAHAIAGAGAEAGADAGVGSGLEGDGYYLPLVFSHHASELAEAIQSKSFDSLEGTLPEEAASHLLAMRPFVEELIRVQASSEWTNYDTETNHEDGLTLSDIASELMPGKLLESVNKHVSIKDSSELHPA
jgi:hypothetical protein